MQALLIVDLLVTAIFAISILGSWRLTRTKTFYVGFGSASVANLVLLLWFGMWKHSPPVFPAEYWKFLGCAAVAITSALVAFVAGWFVRGWERLLLVCGGAVLGILSALVATVSIRVS
jgi:hypothetical protein